MCREWRQKRGVQCRSMDWIDGMDWRAGDARVQVQQGIIVMSACRPWECRRWRSAGGMRTRGHQCIDFAVSGRIRPGTTCSRPVPGPREGRMPAIGLPSACLARPSRSGDGLDRRPIMRGRQCGPPALLLEIRAIPVNEARHACFDRRIGRVSDIPAKRGYVGPCVRHVAWLHRKQSLFDRAAQMLFK